MRASRVLLAMGLSGSIIAGAWSVASAEDRPATAPVAQNEAKESRAKFAKLLLSDGPGKKTEKAAARRRGVVVNAFGATRVIIH